MLTTILIIILRRDVNPILDIVIQLTASNLNMITIKCITWDSNHNVQPRGPGSRMGAQSWVLQLSKQEGPSKEVEGGPTKRVQSEGEFCIKVPSSFVFTMV